MTDRKEEISPSSSRRNAVRVALAAVVVLASLLAVSAWWKSATCGCGSRGLPWETIAQIATMVSGGAIAAYAAAAIVSRPVRRKHTIVLKLASAAACLCLVLGIVLLAATFTVFSNSDLAVAPFLLAIWSLMFSALFFGGYMLMQIPDD